MAFRIIRQRKEARRLAKIEEIFQERDKTQRGKLSLDQIQDVYRIYQVDFDIKFVSKYLNDDGEVTKDDFIKIATETKLTDFHGTKPGVVTTKGEIGERTEIKNSSKLLCCINTNDQMPTSPLLPRNPAQERLLKIERAFRKFDLNGDGFLSWDEFLQIGIDTSTARRIFAACDQTELGQISLGQFKGLVVRRDDDGEVGRL